MIKFDVVRIIHVDETRMGYFWPETPSDEQFKEANKKICNCIGATALCVKNGGFLINMVGHLPYSGWWDDVEVVILGNIMDGYIVNKDQLLNEYNRIQEIVQKYIEEQEPYAFSAENFNEYITTKI